MARRTVYCVQTYTGTGKRQVAGQLRQFGDPADAMREGQALSARRAGVLVFAVSGEPDFNQWEEPRVLARFGEVPRRGA